MFLWSTRSQKQYEWLTDILREVEKIDKGNIIRTHIFITQFKSKFDLRTIMLVSLHIFSPSLVFFHHLNSSKPKYFGRMNSFHIFSLVHFLADTENNHNPLITTHKSLCVCIYCVFSPPPYLQYMAERHFQRVSGTSLFTGLRAITHFSRPDFANIFQSIKKRYFKVSFSYLFNNRHCFTVNHFFKNLSNTNNRVKIL